ncbi:MAG: aconitate hydratase, partial [bacterium]|nr:aconitate hydratase [bacterium]
ARYDVAETIDLEGLEPLVARPTSPGNVVPVREVEGTEISQVVIGSSANPGLRDFAVAAAMARGRQTPDSVSFDVNPTSREIFESLTRTGATLDLVTAGARIHQVGCMGCIGMGQAPAQGTNSLRTFPRNFPGRSGTVDDSVYLCSPETAAASALTGVITDPRTWAGREGVEPPRLDLRGTKSVNMAMLVPPLAPDEAASEQLARGANIVPLPQFDALPDRLEVEVALEVGDNVSTDEIVPAGAAALPFRSNIPKLAEFAFRPLDGQYVERARRLGDHALVAGTNYGQGSSREHAAIAPRSLGLRVVVARSYARIHWQNLANFGVLALEFGEAQDAGAIEQGETIVLEGLHAALRSGAVVNARVGNREMLLRHTLSTRQVDAVLAGGVIPMLRRASA